MNRPCKNSSVILMEDLSGWKSFVPCTVLSKEEIILSLLNVSAFHAKFWKDEKAIRESRPASIEIQTRPAHTSKFRYRSRKKVVNNLKKYSDKFLNEWHSWFAMAMPSNSTLPDWMTVEKSGKASNVTNNLQFFDIYICCCSKW